MAMTCRAPGAHGELHLALAGPMTIYEAAELKQPLLDALQRATALEVDVSQVDDIDTAGVQLLLLLRREAARLQKGFALCARSVAVADVLACYGLAPSFGAA